VSGQAIHSTHKQNRRRWMTIHAQERKSHRAKQGTLGSLNDGRRWTPTQTTLARKSVAVRSSPENRKKKKQIQKTTQIRQQKEENPNIRESPSMPRADTKNVQRLSVAVLDQQFLNSFPICVSPPSNHLVLNLFFC